MVSLTDLWKASKASKGKSPKEWIRLPGTVDFLVACLEKVGKSPLSIRRKARESPRDWAAKVLARCIKDGLVKRTPGINGGTFSHWQVALAYAKYLSPEMHMAANAVFRGYVNADPAMAASIIQRTGHNSPYASSR